jgi:hypothetical protein
VKSVGRGAAIWRTRNIDIGTHFRPSGMARAWILVELDWGLYGSHWLYLWSGKAPYRMSDLSRPCLEALRV